MKPTIATTFDDHWIASPGPLETDCWVWQRACKGKEAAKGGGYGVLRVNDRKREAAHRFSFKRSVGPIPMGLQVMHKCHNTKCVNPSHLLLGTNLENQRMRAVAGKQNSKLTIAAVRKIRENCANGVKSQSVIAKEHGIYQADVSNIFHRKYWAHVE